MSIMDVIRKKKEQFHAMRVGHMETLNKKREEHIKQLHAERLQLEHSEKIRIAERNERESVNRLRSAPMRDRLAGLQRGLARMKENNQRPLGKAYGEPMAGRQEKGYKPVNPAFQLASEERGEKFGVGQMKHELGSSPAFDLPSKRDHFDIKRKR